jgi:hypothetical protein
MKIYKYAAILVAVLAGLTLWSAHAQYFGGGGRGGGGRFRGSTEILDEERLKEKAIMEKALNPEFKEDVFTFARLKYQLPLAEFGRGFGGGRQWDDDTPNADLNLIFRMHDVTSMKIRPGLNYIDITAKNLANYPFVYLASGGRVVFSDDEVTDLRNYLLTGGFIMVDDFWGDDAWAHLHEQMKRIFPDREPVQLTLAHPIFHSVYDFKKLPQIPSAGFYSAEESYDRGFPYDQMGHDPHYFAIYDDKQRMVALLCHNNHYGDGWEHEGDDETYFDRYSLAMGYPMLINILVYTMTH